MITNIFFLLPVVFVVVSLSLFEVMFCFPKDLFAKRNNCYCRPSVFTAFAANISRYDAFCTDRRRRRRRQMDTPSPFVNKNRPLFAVVGCTGTGKTKLGVTLAKELDGEIVSADSIQVYKGLDVATNKATEEETDGVPHHMMGTLDWDDVCNVHEYRKEALKIIEDVYSRGKIPIVVGGTSYYIESIIYNNLVERPGDDGDENEDEDGDDDDDDDHRNDENRRRLRVETAAAAAADDRCESLSVDDFRAYGPFRNVNDAPAADTADGAGQMYADALADAVLFARTMPAFGRLSYERYGHTFAADDRSDDDDDGGGGRARRWSTSSASVVECETAALYAHGVRLLDAVVMAARSTADVSLLRYEVSAADVTAGLLDRHSCVHVRYRLAEVLRTATVAAGHSSAVKVALCRMHVEVVKRTQRFALAVLVDDERTAVDLFSPAALKAHAAYFDPASAIELHPHNTRKVFRIIQIYLKQGKRKSKLLEEQRTRVNGSGVPVVTLRFKEVHMMWLTCDVDVLHRRLDKRTDDMIEMGLVDELCQFKTELSKKTGASDLDFTKGVLQCIGVKQFQRYLELSDEARRTEDGRRALEDAVTAMKTVTKKYARRQMRWINNRFLKSNDKQAVSVYRLDCTDLANWQQLSDRAVDLARVVLGRKPRDERTLQPMDTTGQKTVSPVYGEYYCHDCSRLFSNDIQYNIHMGSKKHVRVMKKRKRKLKDTTLHSDSDNEDKLNSQKKS